MTLIISDGEIHRDWVTAPSGLILAEDVARLRYAPKKHPQGGDIFSGCGGFSCGAKQAGIQMRFAVEYWAAAAVTYMINLGAYPCTLHFETPAKEAEFEKAIVHKIPGTDLVTCLRSGMTYDGLTMDGERRYKVPGTDHMWVWDAAQLTGKQLLDPLGMGPGDLDLLHGSPPCQGVSTTGKQDPHDPRNLLMLEYARLITEIVPKTFTMEQVPNVLNMTLPDGQPIMDAFFDCIEGSGYAARKALQKMMKLQGADEMLLRKGWPAKAADTPKPNRNARRATAAKARKADPAVAEIGAILSRLRSADQQATA